MRKLTMAAAGLALLVADGGANLAAAQQGFPFGREMQLVTAPMKGSRRIPGLEIGDRGDVLIDLWCVQAKGQFVVAGDTLTVVAEEPVSAVSNCTPDRAAADEALMAQLAEVTNWRMQGQDLLLVGPKPLRFRFNTN